MTEQTVAQNILDNPRQGPQQYAGGPFDAPPSNMSEYISKVSEDTSSKSTSESSSTGKYKEVIDKFDKDIEPVKKTWKELRENPPVLEPQPKPPVEQNTDPWQTFGSPAMILATLGSLFTRAPLTAALNAGAGVMKAQADKDEASYKKQMDLFKFNMEQYWKVADYQREVRKAAVEENKDYGEVIDKSFKNETDALLKETQGQEASDKHQEFMDKKLLETKALQPYFAWQTQAKKDGTWNMEEDSKQFRNALVTKAMTEGKGMTGAGAAPTISSGAIDNFAKAVHDGVKPSALGLGYGNNANKAAVLNRVAELYPDFDMASAEADYIGTVAAARTAGTAGSKITLAANSLDQAIPLARDAIKKVDLSNFTSLNQFENYARTHTGDPNISALNTALQTVMSDYSSLIARNGQQTDSTRAAARDLVNVNMAKGQLNAVFDQMEKEKVAQLKAIKETKKEVVGKEAKTVKVSDPQGNPYTIDEAELKEAEQNGWKVRE